MNVVYISLANIPSKTANSIHVMKMGQACMQENKPIELLAPDINTFQGSSEDIWKIYGIRIPFPLKKIKANCFFKSTGYIFRALCYTLKNKFDIVYTRDVKIAMLSTLLGKKTIYEAHSPVTGAFGPSYYKILTLSKRLLKVVTISDALKRYFLTVSPIGIKNKIVVAHDGVDLDDFKNCNGENQIEIRKRLGLPKKRFIVGYTGQLYEGKGMELIHTIAPQMPDTSFVVVGGTLPDIEKWKTKTEHIQNIELIGHVVNSKVKTYLSAFDLLIMPYQEKVFGSSGSCNIANWMSPLKMFEYMASQRAIIASDLPVLKEVLTHKVNAFLANPEDVNDWVRKITFLKEHNEERARVAQEAYALVSQNYTWRRRVQTIFHDIS